MNYLSPSILSADFSILGEQIRMIDEAGAHYVHIDVMDGSFVPNISFGLPVIKSIRKCTDMVFDVHLMIDDPDRYIQRFAEAGADIITIHQEATPDLRHSVQLIKDAGCMASVSIRPETPISVLEEVLPELDMVLLMSVNPGYGGQSFMPHVMGKIRDLRALITDCGYKADIEVDGGVKLSNAKEILEAGVNVLVAGSAVFKNDIDDNVKAFLDIMKEV